MGVLVSDTAIFLTREQVIVLTGAKIKKRQIRMLRLHSIRHYINAAGWPVVPRSAIEFTPQPSVHPTWNPAKGAR